jgi:hypothetical protein
MVRGLKKKKLAKLYPQRQLSISPRFIRHGKPSRCGGSSRLIAIASIIDMVSLSYACAMSLTNASTLAMR